MTQSQNRAEFHALFVPNRSLLCDKRLQDLGVYGSFTFIDELGTFWFPLEADLISMEAPSIFADFHLGGSSISRKSFERVFYFSGPILMRAV